MKYTSDHLALTSFQKELWLSHLALPEEHPGICCGGLFFINSCPEKDIIYKGLSLFQNHFPLISATLRQTDGKPPVFETGVHPKPDVTFLDFRSESDPEKKAEEWLAEFRERAFSPLGGSLYRSALIYIRDDLSWFANYSFHLAGDGFFCLAQFYLLMEYYDSYKADRPFDLPPVPSWNDDIEKDKNHLASFESHHESVAWSDYLKELPRERVFTPLPGCPDSITRTGHHDWDLSLSITKKIFKLASIHGTNVSQVFTAFHLMILSRLYDRKTLCIQVPLRFGEKRDLKKVQGHRVQIAPLIIRVNGESTIKTILQSVQHQFRTLIPLTKTPFQTAFRQLKNGRELSHIWDTSINHIPFIGDENSWDRYHVKYSINSQYDPLLFAVYLVEASKGHGFSLSVQYSVNHFTPGDVEKYVHRLEQFIDEAMDDPETPLSQYPCLLASEQKVLNAFQQGPLCETVDRTIPERFDRMETLYGDQKAVCGEGREGQVRLDRTYTDLKHRSQGIAAWLSQTGVKPGQVVAVMARRDIRLPEIILGIMKAGGIYLPIDPDYPQARIGHMLEDSAATIVIAMEEDDFALTKSGIAVLAIPSKLPEGDIPVCVDTHAPAYLIYTSGSTGKAKGVLISHGSFLNMIQHQISSFGIQKGERVLQFASPSFDASLSEIFMALLGGGCLYPVSRSLIDTPWDLKEYMTQNRISVVTFPPSYLRLFHQDEFPGLRVLITAGEPPIVEDARYYAAKLDYFNAYGPTEASVCASMTQVDPLSTDSFISIGKPIPNTSVYILDRQGRQMAPGIPGELCIGGKGLAIGYLNRPDLNQTRFVSPAFAPEERVYRTGDYAAWTDTGDLLLYGRMDDQVKIRGHRIELGEVNTVLEQQPKVAQAVTIAVPDSTGSVGLHAFIVPSPDKICVIETLINELKSQMPHFMIPSRFHLVETLPVSPTGKVDKHALTKLAAAAMSPDSCEKETGSDLEEDIRGLFETVLNSPVSGLNDDFFALGGDSITAMELIHLIDHSFGCPISIRELMKEATIASVARNVSGQRQTNTDRIQDHCDDTLFLNQGQFQLWAQNMMTGPSPSYNMPFALHIEADENRMNAFCDALEKAVETQPSFQSCIITENDHPYLKLSASSGFLLEHRDLRHDAARINTSKQLFDTAIHAPFDLNRRPLIRAMVLRMADDAWHLLIVMHHIIGDGESIKKLLSASVDYLNGKTVNPVHPFVLKQFVEKENQYLASSDAREDRSFWKNILTPLPERLDFFPHQNRPPLKTAKGNHIQYPLTPEASKGLHTLSEQAHTPLFVCFLALLMEFIKTRTGKKDAALSVPVGLRDTPDLSNVAGYFVNLVILRSSSDHSTDLQETVLKTWETYRKALEHSRYPFGLLPGTLNLVHDPSRSPLVDILATSVDASDFIPDSCDETEMTFRPLPVSLRASKMDYAFILSSGMPQVDETGHDHIESHMETLELILEYDIHLASQDEAASLLTDLLTYIENRVTGTLTDKKDQSHTLDTVFLAWEKILGGIDYDETSNFFECGGDSIKAIQMVGYLRQNGITGITPAQIFQHPTLGGLRALVVEKDQSSGPSNDLSYDQADIPIAYPKPEPGEFIDLLPIQERMFRQQKDHWKHYHMILPMQLADDVDVQRIPQALQELSLRHEALQTAFLDQGKGLMLKYPADPVWETLSIDEPVSVETAVQQGADMLFQCLAPSAGRLFGAVMVRTTSATFLILGGHHLILDAVSLVILCREISWYCRKGEWPVSGIQPGMATWARQLANRQNTFPDDPEKKWWKDICAHACAPLAALKSTRHDTVLTRMSKTRTLPSTHYTFSSNPRSDLLAGLSCALHSQGQHDPIFITLEGHGRENLFPSLDISQSMGWFTTTFPMVLTPSENMDETAIRISNGLDELPHNGLGYGILRQRAKDTADYSYTPQITFNYLGQIFSEKDYDGFTSLPLLTHPSKISGLLGDDFYFDTPLDLSVFMTPEGDLELSAAFSPHCLDPEWVDALLLSWESALTRITVPDETPIPSLWKELAETCQCSVEEIESVFPPLLTQEGMLFQHLMDNGAAGTYTQQIHLRLNGELDRNLFKQAWDCLLERHGALRTLYPFDQKGECHCLMLKRSRMLMDMTDLSGLPHALQQDLRNKKIADLKCHPFDLEKGPLFHIHLVSFGTDDHEMSLHFHHILMDGWCLGILLRELFTVYDALARKALVSLDPAPDLKAYQQFIRQFDMEKAKTYWQGLLEGFSGQTWLTRTGSCAAKPTDRFCEFEWHLSQNTTRGLTQHAAQKGVTLPNLLQAAWSILLGGFNTTCRDTVFGLVSSGRPAQVDGMENMVGMFIQTLPVRASWKASDSLYDLALKLQQQALDKAAYEYYPLADIQRIPQVRLPLFDHILVFENYPTHGMEQTHAPVISSVSGFEQHPYAFCLSVIPGHELTFRFSYPSTSFSESERMRLKESWEAMLLKIAQDQSVTCRELEELVQPQETFKHSVHVLFSETTAKHPDQIALIGTNGEVWTYEKLNRVTDAIARGLDGPLDGDVIAFSLPREPLAVAVMLGILKAGGVYLPLDDKTPPRRIRHMLEIASCKKVVLCQSSLSWLQTEYDAFFYDDLSQTDLTASRPQTEYPGDHPAYVMFTSGSTGEPKGVVVPHRAIVRLVIENDFWDIAPGERMLQAGPLGFDASTLEIWGPLLNGATVSFICDDDLLSPIQLKKKLEVDRVSMMWLTASLCHVLADEDAGIFAPLRRLMTGGEALSPPHMKRIMDACPLIEIMNGYGPTENTTFTTTHILRPVDVETGSIPIGKPVTQTRVYILDEDNTPVPDGQWGEICAAGNGLALGYIGRDDLTRKVFVDLPEPVSERVYKTGDIGRKRHDGLIEYKGRKDAQVKVRGYRIELTDIETALMGIPFVKRAAVVAPQTGSYRTLVAWIQTDRENKESIKNSLKDVLPAYMIPDEIHFTRDFPITRNGKLDRAELERRTGKSKQTNAGRSFTDSNRETLERQVADIFEHILEHTVDSPDADFFELGGQSLKAMRLMLRLNHAFDVELNVRDVMTHTTVKTLARRIREITSSGPMQAIPHTGQRESYPMSRGQERLWFLQRMYPETAVYGVPFVVRLTGDIDRDALQQALTTLETWHDALCMRVPDHMEENALSLKIAPPGETNIDFKDFSGTDDPVEATAMAVDREINRPFSFGFDSPLLRASLFREAPSSHVFLLNVHHLICDGWSGEIVIRDLNLAYERALNPQSQQPHRPSQPVRYVDYALWQKQYLAGPAGETLRQRWLERLSSLPDALDLQGDRPWPLTRSFKGAAHQFILTPDQKQGLADCAGRLKTTLFPVLVALVKTFLYRHTGQEDILVGVPVAGREHWQLEHLVGFFVNTVVLRNQLSVDHSFDTLVTQVKTSLEDAMADQAYPFESLVESLNLPRDASRNPLFDVLVSFEDKEWDVINPESAFATGLTMSAYPVPHKRSKLDLSFYFRETLQGVCVDIEYSTDLFDPATIQRMAERFKALTDAVVLDAEASLQTLDIMPGSEREQVLHGFNDTVSDINCDQSIDGLLLKQVHKTPKAPALCSGTGEILSFEQLNTRVNALARDLKKKGVVPGAYVGVSFQRSFDLIASIFAVLRLGAVYVPFIPELPLERVASMGEDLEGCMVLTQEDSAEKFLKCSLPVICVNGMYPETEDIDQRDEHTVSPDTTAYVIFTSGSTGRPKGVPITHLSVVNRIQWMQSCFPLGEKDVILQKTPISFDVSVWELFWWSWSGATLAQLPPGQEKDPQAIVDAVERHGVTVMHFVPSMLRMFLAHIQMNPDTISRLKTLKYVFASGEALTPDVTDVFNILLYTSNKTELHNLYGPTEATVDVTWYPCSPKVTTVSVPIGRPISNTRIYILDSNQAPVPIGVAGEIYISGIQVSSGYINRPDLTSAAFGPDPFVPGNRMYRTGDKGRWLPDGDVEYLGRNDNQIKLRGFRIELGDVEAALERVETVSQAIVRMGDLGGLPCLEAFLVCPEHSGLTLESIRRQVADVLPDYMMPAMFYRIDRVPLNSSGKADRKALAGERLFQKQKNRSSREVTSLEKEVTTLWQQVFRDTGPIDRHDHFFDIGGNSLLVTMLYELLDSAWPDAFTIADLFVQTTIHQQAAWIDEKTRDLDRDGDTIGEPLPDPKDAVAVIGMALRLADYESPEDLWSDLLTGTDQTGPMPGPRTCEYAHIMEALGYRTRAGQIPDMAYLDDITGFDCKRFGMAPTDVRLMDPEFRLFLETAFRALEDGGYGGSATDGGNVGIFAGASPSPSFKQAVFQSFPDRAEQGFVLNIPSSMATRLGYMKDWKGPASLVDTACSSALKAIDDACKSLLAGECRMAVAGGARIILTPLKNGKSFAIETVKGKTRPFDADADGVGAGEGSVIFLLKPLSQALADHDAIRAVILGGAVNQDGRSAGIAAPNPVAQSRVIAQASINAGVDLSTLDFFEAHGTGTALGDPIEIDGLTRAFKMSAQSSGKNFNPDHQVAIGSVKGIFGHLDSAAGALGMAKAILSLEHGVVPHQAHFNSPNPRIDFNHAPVFVNQNNLPLSDASRPWRCGVSAFGLSGINVHMILEQAPERTFPEDDGTCHILPLSAGSEQGLVVYAEQILHQVAAHREWPLHAISATLTAGRDHLPFRLAIPAVSRDEFVQKLMDWRLSETGPATPVVPLNDSVCLCKLAYRTADDQAAVEKACRAFLNGAKPCWPDHQPLYRVHLPQPPLDRVPCWPEFSKKAREKQVYQGFLGEGIQTKQGWAYKVPVASDDFWPLSEHRLGDNPTLVGMAAIPLFSEAFNRIRPSVASPGILSIKGLNWLKPLKREQVVADSVVVMLQKQEGGTRVSLYGCDRHGEWGDFMEARLSDSAFKESDPEKLNLNKLLKDFSHVTAEPPPESQANASHGLQVDVSARWDCLTRKWRSHDGKKTLALLELPQEYHRDTELITPHPALMDVAASLALNRSGMVPVGCGEIRLLRPVPPRLYALVTKQDVPETMGTPFLHVDCRLWDAETRLPVIELKDLMFAPVQLPGAQIHGLTWVEQKAIDIDVRNTAQKRWMIIGESRHNDPFIDQLILSAKYAGLDTLKEKIPVNDSQRTSLALNIADQGITHIFYRVPSSEKDPWTFPAMMKAICEQGLVRPLHVVAAGTGGIGGAGGDAALTLGVLLSLSQEEPMLDCRYIEMDGDVPEESILAEVFAPPGQTLSPVKIDTHGKRYARELGPVLSPDVKKNRSKKDDDGSCIVFTGGLGAMSLTLAEAVLSFPGASVALIHRGEFPETDLEDEITESSDPALSFRVKRLKYLKEKGTKIKGYRCDVCSRDALDKTLRQVRKDLGPIGGLVHTAGIPGKGFLIRKSQTDFEKVLAPKVDAVRNLHDLTLNDPLRFFVMASSRTALTGAPGQTDYTAANAWMDAFAHWRKQQGLPGLSINWNTWADVGMAAWNHVPSLPGTAILPEQALSVFMQSLSLGQAQVAISMAGEMTMNRKETVLGHDVKERPDTSRSLHEQILDMISQILEYDTPLSEDDDFYALGGDSITGALLVNRINRELGQNVSLSDLFTYSKLGDFIKAVTNGNKDNVPDASMLTAPPDAVRYPVSREQLAVIRVDALSIPNTGYNLPQFLELPKDIDPKRLEFAIQELIDRHDILRTRFIEPETDSPGMDIRPTLSFSLDQKEIGVLDAATVKELVKPFQLSQAPLFRALLLHSKKMGMLLFFDIHHAVADARTIDILLTELYSLYEGRRLEKPGPQQKDAAWAQHFLTDSKKEDDAKAYWLRHFDNPLPCLDLPADYPRPAFHTFVGDTTQFDIPKSLIPRIRSLAKRHATTTYTLMLSVWAMVLSRYAGKDELVMSVAADSREGETFSSATGMFASLLPLKIHVDERQPFGELLHRNHQRHGDAIRHQSFPLSQLLSELKPPMRPERTVLSEVTFSYMNFNRTRSGSEASETKEFKRLFMPNPACKADISIFATDTGDHLMFALEYYADLFSRRRMEKMGKDFLSLLNQVLEDTPDGQKKPPISHYVLDLEPNEDREALEPFSIDTPVKAIMPEPVDETFVLDLFRTVFDYPSIEKDDSFFDLGGHSLLGLQVINRINKALGTTFSIRDLFENPTPEMLADLIACSIPHRVSPVSKKATSHVELIEFPEGCYPLSHAQQRLYVLHHTHGGNTAYNMPFVFHVHTRLNTRRFRHALVKLCQRHDILRTAFVEDDGQIWQKIYPDAVCPVKVHRLTVEDREKALALFRDDAAAPFDLKKHPLFKIRICHLGNQSSLLLLLMHHIIADGWSMQIFFKELMYYYSHGDKVKPLILSPLGSQYKDYALFQQNKNWEKEAGYWKKKLDRAQDRIMLPEDGNGKPRTLPVGVCRKTIPDSVMAPLRDYARNRSMSLATLFLTFFSALLYRLTRQEDMVIGMGVAGRENQDIEGLIGFFVNILPIRVTIDDDTEFESLLDQVHTSSLEALERQGYPFDLLIRELYPGRRPEREALINVMFEYQRFGDVKGITIETSDSRHFETTLIDLYGKTAPSHDVGPVARYDLTFFVQDDPDGCHVRAEFDRGMLCGDTVETWLQYFDIILTGIVTADAEENNENI